MGLALKASKVRIKASRLRRVRTKALKDENKEGCKVFEVNTGFEGKNEEARIFEQIKKKKQTKFVKARSKWSRKIVGQEYLQTQANLCQCHNRLLLQWS